MYHFYYQGEVKRVYVGSGQKYETERFFPLFPPSVLDDPEELGEEPEPTPLEAPPPEKVEDEDGEEGGEGNEDQEEDEEQ